MRIFRPGSKSWRPPAATISTIRPAKTPSTWPYVNSRGTGLQEGANSQDTYNFVSWVRIDDEILKILASPSINGAGNVALTVERGVFGARMQVELVNDGPVTLMLET